MGQQLSLVWLLPQEPGLATHVTLHDGERHPDPVLAIGQGADEPEALLDLWTRLVQQGESEEALMLVADAFAMRTGKAPEQMLE